MKKFLISLMILFFAGITVTGCMAVAPKKDLKPSDYDLGMTYEKAAKEDKPIIAVFYADWCTYCIRFMPKLDSVRNIYKDKFNVVLLNVESEQNKKLVDEYRISGFPTVYIIDPEYDNRVHIDGPYLESVKSLSTEVGRYAKIRELIKKGSACK